MITNNDLKYMPYRQNVYIGHNELLDKEIVRYTSLENLKLLLDGRLYATQRKQFIDKRECGRVRNLKNAFRFQLASGIDSEHWKQVDDKIMYAGELLTSCWSSDTQEDVLMWKAYNATVRIKTTVKKMLDFIYDPNIKMIFCNRMRYEQERPYYMVEEAMFSKNYSYHNEQEIRFYFDVLNKKESKIAIQSEGIIDEILISPFMGREAKLLLEYIKQEFTNLNVNESAIIENKKI